MDGSAEIRPATLGRARMAPRSKMMLAVAVGALAAIAAIAVLATGAPSSVKASPPATARTFTLPELGQPGRKISLAALHGRPVIINFFASWCSPCKRETPLLARFYRSEHGRVLIIGVDSNDVSANALRFVRADGVEYPVAADTYPAPVTVSYGVEALPQTFFLSAQHKILRRVYGDVTQAELTSWAATVTRQKAG
jgi:cytochrome c biogenesis protein CcmG, thiol:disulfide interchange protein DsbE